MKISALTGVMDWRILINFKAELSMLRSYLPAPFVPRTHLGFGMAGICLLNQKNQRIKGLPSYVGLHSYQTLYWIAVCWQELGEEKHGYFIPKRYTSSFLQALTGGKGYPGLYEQARFRVKESDQQVQFRMDDRNGLSLQMEARMDMPFPSGSVMRKLETAQTFFHGPMLGVSPRYKLQVFDLLELQAAPRPLEALRIDSLADSFFHQQLGFPVRSILFDHALIQTSSAHQWIPQRELLAPRQWNHGAYSAFPVES